MLGNSKAPFARAACAAAFGLALAALSGCGNPGLGGCNPLCGAGTACVAGVCVNDSSDGAVPDLAAGGPCHPACKAGTYCNAKNQCVPCLKDEQCPTGQICKPVGDGALCAPGCNDDARCKGANAMSPLACCMHACVDTTADPANCGACGTACSSAHGSSTCNAGQCALSGQCDPGWGDCNKDPKDGCEANLHIDPANCSGCGMKCAIPNAVSACADGCYETACKFGFDDCNGDPMDGCETSVLSDGANCGACGMSCSALPHASAACMNAQCVLGKCDPGYFDCNGDPKDGCEANLMSDAKNCAKCGVTCPMNIPYCAGGVCQNGCVNGHPVPDACTSGKDPETGDPWSVCTADCNMAWVSHSDVNGMGGHYHALQICKGLGYSQLGKYGGTCMNVCGRCEPATSCMKPGMMNFGAGNEGNCGMDGNGPILCMTVHWQCLK